MRGHGLFVARVHGAGDYKVGDAPRRKGCINIDSFLASRVRREMNEKGELVGTSPLCDPVQRLLNNTEAPGFLTPFKLVRTMDLSAGTTTFSKIDLLPQNISFRSTSYYLFKLSQKKYKV